MQAENSFGKLAARGFPASGFPLSSPCPLRSTRVYAAAQPAYPYGAPYMPPYANPYMNPYMQQPTLASSLLGRISTGQLIDVVVQIFAALMPLPGAPTATSDVGTDVGNLMLYQGALAQYAKRDEQVRTLGNLILKLIG